MKKHLPFLLFLVVLAATLGHVMALAAEVAVPAAVPAITATPAPSLMAWFTANQSVILGAALVLSELLACIPAFKGNGIIDALIKGLKALRQKQAA